MRATLNIPDDLISEVQKISKEESKTHAVITAMEAYVKDRKTSELISLRGKITLYYDWRKEESAELRAQKKRSKHLKN